MYLKYSTKVKVGMAIFAASICAVILLLLTIGMSMETETTEYKVIFNDESVSGLTSGSFIKLLGVEIGKVTKIKLSEDDINSIEVTVSINEHVHIKKDMYATMNAIGITGLKYIEITGGTNDAENIKSGGVIPSKKSPFSEITDKMETMSYKVTELLTNLTEMTGKENRQSFSNALSNLDKLTRETSRFSENVTPKLEESITRLNSALEGADQMFKELTPVIKDVKKVTGTMTTNENLGNMDNIVEQTNSMVEETSETLKELKVFVKNMNVVLQDKNSSTTELMKSMETISINLEQFSEKINRNPSLLFTGDAENEDIGR